MKDFPKIVFMGTPDFAVASLKTLLENNYPVVGVITAPDKPAGRGQKIQESAVKKFAAEKGLHILQPTNLKDEAFLQELANLQADLQIVVAFRMLPEKVWSMPKEGTFNLHGSLLPQYRGAAPINWAIMNGEKESGVTTFFLKHQIDTGNIILQEKVAIEENDTAGDLHDRLMEVGAELVLKTVAQIEAGNVSASPQEESTSLKEAPKIFKEDCRIDWSKNIDQVHDFIRGLSPYPTAHTVFKSESGEEHSVKIFKSKKDPSSPGAPGKLNFEQDQLKVTLEGGAIIIEELQVAGKKRMKAADFIRGFDTSKSWTAV